MGGGVDCGKDPSQFCDVCDRSILQACSASMTCDMCMPLGKDETSGAKIPLVEGNDWSLPPYNTGDDKCGCQADFVAAWTAGTWVKECASSAASTGGGTDASASSAPPA